MEISHHAPNLVVLREARSGDWLVYKDPIEVVQAWDKGQVIEALNRVETAVDQQELWAAGFISYEAAPAFDSALSVRTLLDWRDASLTTRAVHLWRRAWR